MGLGQISPIKLLKNEHFKWVNEELSGEITIHYPTDSWTNTNSEKVKSVITRHIQETNSFIGIEAYPHQIHLFIVSSREEMKQLIGYETNGSAFYKSNTVTGIYSKTINSIYANHELFHVMAMNVWGKPELWINEGMAVYADNQWHGYDLHQLAHYLINNDRVIDLEILVNDFRSVDDLLSYPLAGSFAKYLDEVYGRETLIRIWKSKAKKLEKIAGKSIGELEVDWINVVKKVDYVGINY